ncbi:RNA-binding protein 47 [Bienertia sinuspersici]
MSLDDIIKSKKSGGRGRGRGGGAPRGRGPRGSVSGGRMSGIGRGAGRQGPLGVNTRPSSFAIAKASPNFGYFLHSF